MPPAPLPDNEQARLDAIAGNPQFQSMRDPWTDELVRAASNLTGCPIALVTILDRERQWFRGCVGLDSSGTPREQAFCGYTILSDEPLVVEDATKDERFRENPLVTGFPFIRFYAGVPLYDDAGIALGSLCVIDAVPRKIDASQLDGLEGLARIVTMNIASNRRYQAMLSASLDAIVTINSDSTVLEFNEPAERLFGYTREEAIGSALPELIIPTSLREGHRKGMERYLATGEGPVLGRRVEILAMRKGGEEFPVELTISPHRMSGLPCFTAFVRDLTETSELTRDLRLTRFSVEQSRDAIFWIAPDASFTYVNVAACTSLGYSEDELTSMKVFDIEEHLGEDAWPEHWSELKAQGSLLLESEHRRKDGSTFPVEVACNFVEHEGAEFNCVVARDISERKSSQEALGASEARFRDIAEAAGEYIWETDPDLKYVFATRPIEGQLGVPLEKVIGRPMLSFMPEDESNRVAALLERSRVTSEPFRQIEVRCTSSEGEERWQRLSRKPLFDVDGNLLGYRGMGLDVTAFKRVGEQQRRVSALQEIVRSAISSFLDPDRFDDALAGLLGVLGEFYGAKQAVVDKRTDEGWASVLTWVPEGASPLAGFPAPSVGDRVSSEEVVLVEVLHSGPDWSMTLSIVVDQSVERRIRFHGCASRKPITTEEELLRSLVAGVVHSIERAERKRELIEAAEELERALALANEASDAKTAFLAHMSHELRTPLTGVLGFAKMLRTRDHSPTDRDAVLDKIDQNGRALLDIINSILDLSKIETGVAVVQAVEVDLRVLIASSVSAIVATAADKGLRFNASIGPAVPARFVSDEVRIKQILINLLSNAVKYTDQGSVELKVDASDGPHKTLILEIRDTGRGISREQQEHVFQAFERGAATTDIGGTGLGLAIVARLVDLLGGALGLESTPGEGSVFRVRLPVEQASEDLLPEGGLDLDLVISQPSSEPRTRLDGLRIMLVEDSPHVREVVHYFIRDRGATVRMCHDGSEAVQSIRDGGERPDIVLMDMQMPVMDGYEATRTLRSAGIDLPIVALTAHGMQHERERCLAAGCDEYLSKPVDPDALADLCARLTRTKARAEPAGPESSGVDTDAMASLKRRFARHLASELRTLQSEEALSDLDATRRRVHKLAGSAGNLGFPRVTDFARACESTIQSGAPRSEVEQSLRDLVRVIHEDLGAR
ncbi:MAG: PAS domain S-box protein [Planctomycetota bacterium]